MANGSYFWAADQVIVLGSGVPAMTTAIRQLVRSADGTSAAVPCEDRTPGPLAAKGGDPSTR
jgi:hypothetical protein